MKLNIKWTALSFVACGTMAAGAFACSVSSGTVNDTDGGTSSTSSGSSSGSTTSSSGSSSGGTDSGPATCDNPRQKDKFSPAACQECLDGKCCTELKTCFNIVSPDGGTTIDCNAYTDCVADCENKDGGTSCIGLCKSAAEPGVVDGEQAIRTCAKTNCATACGL